jgi:hypothetical protein
MSKNESVKVVVRFRPLNSNEKKMGTVINKEISNNTNIKIRQHVSLTRN